MLRFMRRHAASLWIKLLFGLLAAVFIYWGIGAGLRGTQRLTPAAKVNGIPITEKELERAHENLLRFYREVYGEQFRPELLQAIDTRGQALDQLIRTELLYQAGLEWGLEAGDAEVRDAIAQMPAFRTEDGRFDKDFYVRVLRANRMSPGEFEESVRRDVVVKKVQDIALAGVYVAEDDVRQHFQLANEKVNLSYVEFEPSEFLDQVKLDEGAIQAYYEQHKESFREPERVKVEYVLYEESAFVPKAEVKDEEVQRYYDEHQDEFSVPERVRARHILLKVEPTAPAESKEEVRKKAQEVLERARKGEDFAQLAKEFSEDPGSAADGGDLGFFERGKMVAPFEAVAFSLEPGSISDLVETQFGYHIIKVEAKEQAHTRSLDEVRNSIAERLRKEKARELAEQQAAKDRTQAAAGQPLAELAAASGLAVRVAGPFAQGEAIEGLGSHPLSRAAFETKVQEVGPVVRAPGQFVVFKVLEKTPSFIPELPAIQKAVAEKARSEKARELAREKAEALLSAAKESSLEAAAKAQQKELEETGAFSFEGGFVPHIGTAPEVKRVAFQLSPEAPLAPQVFSAGDAFYVVALKEKVPADMAEFEKQKESLKQQVAAARRSEVLEEFVNGLKARAKIELGPVQVAASARAGAPLGRLR